MKVIAGLVATTLANNGWIANTDAPHCGCQIFHDASVINKTCSVQFTYPKTYGNDGNLEPHFVSVASTYMVGRERFADAGSKFKFTGYDEVTNPNQLDILVFYEQSHCCAPGKDCVNTNFTAIDQSTIWEYFAMDDDQKAALCDYQVVCPPEDEGFVPGVHLGNFNYDIARSVQTYTVPIYGLEKDQKATFTLKDYDGDDNNCMNALAHSGHGTAGGCSTNSTGTALDCSNEIFFIHNEDHNGLLEYFQFEPVSPANNKQCFEMPIHHIDDYEWKTPSPWDTQQAGVTIE